MANELLARVIKEGFSSRSRPDEVVCACLGGDEIAKDAFELSKLSVYELTCDWLERHPDCIFGITALAFHYYLPGVLCATVNEDSPDIKVVYALVAMLDRGTDVTLWNDFFIARWMHFSANEYEALKQWVMWLSEWPVFFDASDSLGRALDVLCLISENIEGGSV